MDKAPCWMEMKINKTVAKIGEKEISVKTFNMDQLRLLVVLCIIANGGKLPPIIVFKGKSNPTLEKRLQNFVKQKNYNVKIYCHEKGWVDKILFEKWLTEIWFINYSLNQQITRF